VQPAVENPGYSAATHSRYAATSYLAASSKPHIASIISSLTLTSEVRYSSTSNNFRTLTRVFVAMSHSSTFVGDSEAKCPESGIGSCVLGTEGIAQPPTRSPQREGAAQTRMGDVDDLGMRDR